VVVEILVDDPLWQPIEPRQHLFVEAAERGIDDRRVQTGRGLAGMPAERLVRDPCIPVM
jgi:hypothetical protein